MTAIDELLATLVTIELLRPAWLLALAPLALLLAKLTQRQHDAGGWRAVVAPHLLPHVTIPGSPSARRLALGLSGAGLVAAVIALAGPALPQTAELAYRNGAARVFVVDLSPAMSAGEGGDRRIERVRLKLLALLQAAAPGQTALIAYAEEPYLVAPPTTDAATVALLVPELEPEIVPLAGDRPERALQMAADVLARSGGPGGDVIWLTSNREPSATVAKAAIELAERNLSLSVLDAADPSAVSQPAAAALQRAAEATGGVYLALRADGDDVRRLAARLDGGEAAIAAAHRVARPREIGVWLLPLLLPLAALAFRRGVLLALVVPLLLVPPVADAADFAALWLNRDRQAARLLAAGDPTRAAELFADPRWRAVANYRTGRFEEAATLLAPFDDADSHYNRGNALARLDRLDEALAAFDAALRLRPGDEDTVYNRDLVRERLARHNDTLPPREQDSDRDDSAAPPAPRHSAPPNPANGGPAHPSAAASSGAQANVDRPPPLSASEPPANTAPKAEGAADPRRMARGQRDPRREADLLADQWLRRVPHDPGGLLQRKLALEHQRREAGELPRPWR
ncbi:MAG: VWA domain-containing protein [Aromatoleum sp.]|uniref:VWA domain-containing protein n=1 Tax=Aromatoleum sp. TaxID=2307007 RepID=UPI0028960446|nr:VWA domain-containing protein [Aromatoleum sp.]MDT3670031.1 VWA domain-containing protein [Aromatoleum sp.]